MLDRLFDFLASVIDSLKFACIVDQYEAGVVLRFGKFHRKLEPGFHFVWPLGIEEVFVENCVPSTISLGTQSLTTADGVSVVISAVLTWRIRDICKMLLEVEDAESVLEDSSYGLVGATVQESTWDEVRGANFANTLYRAVREKAFRYGIEVTAVQLSDISQSKSLRLWQD